MGQQSPMHSGAQPQTPPQQEPPRRSGRVTQRRIIPDNVYGQTNPTDIDWMTQEDWQNTIGNVPAFQRGPPVTPVPQPFPPPFPPTWENEEEEHPQLGNLFSDLQGPAEGANLSYLGHSSADSLLVATQEGGAPLINFLLTMAIPPHEQGALSSTQSVQDWHFRDILWLPTREQEEWKNACCEELESLRTWKVFELTDLPKGKKVIKNRWVFNIKQDSRKKARLIAKGFSQVEGIDFNEIFSPVVHFETVRLMLALSSLEDWYIEALDVKMAFLYRKLDEEIYMHQPEGFKQKGQENKVLRLHRALYSDMTC